jgi:phosphate transport system substrate-binding protein
MRRIASIALLLLAAACIQEEKKPASKPGAAPPAPVKITIKGSDAMRALGVQLAATYAKKHPAATFDVQGGGTAAGIAALTDGSADVAQASRPLTPGEKSSIESKRGAKVEEVPLAFDVIGIYVNDANPVKQLSFRQLGGLVDGSLKSWSGAGGPSAPVRLYGEADAVGFTSYMGLAAAPHAQRDFAEPRGAIAAVASDPNGLAWAHAIPTSHARLVWIQRTDGGEAVAPSAKTVLDRSYPLSGKVYWVVPANAKPAVRDFVNWTRSAEGTKVIEDAGYIGSK